MKSSHPGGSRGVQLRGLVLVLPVRVRGLFVLPVLPGPGLVLPVSVRVLFVRPVLGPSVRPVLLLGLVLVLPVSVRSVRPPGPSVLLRPRVRVLSLVGHSVTGGQVHS